MNSHLIDDALQTIISLLNKCPTDQDIAGILRDLLTPAEIEEIALRITIFQKLLDGQTQREVAQNLGISVTTVSRGAKELKYGTGNIKKILMHK